MIPNFLDDFAKLSCQCMPFTIDKKFGAHGYPNCIWNTPEYACSKDFAFYYPINASATGSCLRPCKINEYFGKITYLQEEKEPNHQTAFAYFFKTPEAKSVEEEYIIYELVSIIAATGGALGLCKDLNGESNLIVQIKNTK